MHLPAILIMILVHLHLTMLEPAIKDAIMVARNPTVQKDVKAAAKAFAAYEKKRKAAKQPPPH
jgi:hypothetical protein